MRALVIDRPYLTDAGLETDMVFNRGIDLPCFSSLVLLRTLQGRQALEDYYRGFLALAHQSGSGFILESATWRASPDWAAPLGLSIPEMADLNRAAVALLHSLKAAYDVPVLVSGCIGPRGDGYDPGTVMTVETATDYHSAQLGWLAEGGAQAISAITMTNTPEAIGISRAAAALGLPVVISFTVETNGLLPTGQALGDAIAQVDLAMDAYPAYYMINCAHPSHFATAIDGGASWIARLGGIRANASCLSHAELDQMTELDAGDPDALAADYAALCAAYPHIKVLGGCCGTDLRHITAIAHACLG